MRKTFLKVSFWSLMALGMATSFTACKDYDDDIDQLRKEVAQNADAIKQINSLISSGSVITDVTSNANGIVIKLSNGKEYPITNGTNGTNGTVWTIGDDGYWYKDGVKTDYKALGEDGQDGAPGQDATGEAGAAGIYYRPNTETGCFDIVEPDGTVKPTNIPYTGAGVTAVVDGDYVTLSGVKDAEGNTTSVTISMSGALRSLVFIPELYEGGVEATRYAYAPVKFYTNPLTGTTVPAANAEISDDGKKVDCVLANTYAFSVDNGSTVIYPTSTVTYELNPANANVNGLKYQFLTDDVEYVQGRAATPAASFVSAEKEDGNLVVSYKVNGAEGIKYLTKGENGELSVMALEATLAEGETVTSDYAAILPAVRTLKAISYTEASKYTTTEAHNIDLYTTGVKAVQNVATIKVAFDGGNFNLAEKLQICYTQADFVAAGADAKVQYMTLAELADYGLSVKYQMMDYKVGQSVTEEQYYGKISSAGVFTPCYVDADGKQAENGTDGAGVSSVGRRPVVIVTVTNAEGKVALAGYVKFLLTTEEDVAEPVDKFYDLNSETTPYVCSFEAKSNWKAWSGQLLESLGLDHNTFNANYAFVPNVTFVKNDEGKAVQVTNNIYGVFTFQDDLFAQGANGVLTWNGNTLANVDAIYKANDNHSVTLYAKFSSKKGTGDLYISLTVTVNEKPAASYGVKYLNQWYASSTGAANSRVNVNVPAPTTTNDVTKYVKDLNEYFIENKVVISTTTPGYDLAQLGTTYQYQFSATQPKVGDYQLTASADQKSLLSGTTVIATLSGTNNSTLTYSTNDVAKEILNLFSHSAAAPDWTFANLEIAATYGECKIPFTTPLAFEARFLRPVDIVNGDDVEFVDAQANGSEVAVGLLFSLTDWRDQAIIKLNDAGTAVEACVENGVNLYTYYKFKTLAIDKSKVQVLDVEANTWYKLAQLPGLDLQVKGITDVNGVYTISDISSVNALNTNNVIWYNNSGTTKEFSIKIPVTITYSWGTLNAEVTAKVKKTIAN